MERNDLISRKALLEAFDADVQHLQRWDVDLFDLMIAEIRDAPAVKAEPVRHGRWRFEGLWGECSNCGYAISVDEERTTYCPNCGAKMDLEGGSER